MPISGPSSSPPVVRPGPGGAGIFPHSLVLIQRAYGSSVNGQVPTDVEGEPVEASSVFTAFNGWIQPSPVRRRVNSNFGQDASDDALTFASHVLFAPIGLPARRRDRVRFEPDDGRVYEVAADPQDAAGRRHHLEVDLVEYRAPRAVA